ncbi:unnamed protein product, partial [Schistocephalus solidus]|uniref:F5/8 type C domain-containing protein n=1 Tax=Schistocephalus solidus TaxID=70667 RepID=A0A183SXT2_SCHSO
MSPPADPIILPQSDQSKRIPIARVEARGLASDIKMGQPPAFGECKSNLLDKVPEAAFECSSSVSQRYGPSAARISSKDPTMQYRAWCPSKLVSMDEQEYLQVDLGRQHFIKLIITKGLSTEAKRIKGNLDAQTERYVTMNPPFVARWVRIYPFNHEPVTVCLKLEIIGCDAGGIMEYQAPMGTLLPPGGSKFGDQSLLDTSYDNRENRTTMVRSALSGADGRASSVLPSVILSTSWDGKHKHALEYDAASQLTVSGSPLPSSAFVGWKRNGEEQSIFNGIASRQDYVRLVFFFDDLYNFTGLRILLANTLGAERALPRLIEARLGRQSRQDGAVDTATTLATAIEPLVSSAMAGSQWLHLDIARTQSTATGAGGAVDEEKAQSTLLSNFTSEYDTVARFVELRIYYGGPWIAIGEVSFMN